MHAAFQPWTHVLTRSELAPVYPDGCRDVLILRQPGRPVQITLTPFDLRPRVAALAAGTALSGYRLRPGATLTARALRAIATDPGRAPDILDNDLSVSSDADAAIRALCVQGSSTLAVARGLGVSVRSLQRLFHRRALPPPDYWRLLARARQAAGLLAGAAPLAAIAADCGFSDQAHMSREILRWFGQTPRQLRQDARMLALLGQPALGNWTGEQISTR